MRHIFLMLGFMMASQSYSQWNSSYHKQSDFQFEAGKKAIDSLHLKGDEAILDIGCGTGRTTGYCASKITTGTIHGIDAWQEVLDVAVQECKNHPFVTFERMSVVDMAYREQFDVVYSLLCLHWVKEQQEAIAKIVASLKPGGKGLLYIACENDLVRRWRRVSNDLLALYPELRTRTSEYIFLQLPQTWIEWLYKTGASGVTHRLLERTKIFASPQELKEFLLALGIEPKMNPEQREFFIEQTSCELYKDYNLPITGPFEYTTSTLVLEFSK